MYQKYSRVLAALALSFALTASSIAVTAQAAEFSTRQYVRVSSDSRSAGFEEGSVVEISNAERGTYLEAISVISPVSGNDGSVVLREVTWNKDWSDSCINQRFNSKDCTFSFDASSQRARLEVSGEERKYTVRVGQTISIPVRNALNFSANDNRGESAYYVLTLQNVSYAKKPFAEFRGTIQKSPGSNAAPSAASSAGGTSSTVSGSTSAAAPSFSLPTRTAGMSETDYLTSVQRAYLGALGQLQALAYQYNQKESEITPVTPGTQEQGNSQATAQNTAAQKELSAIALQITALQEKIFSRGITPAGSAAAVPSSAVAQAPGVCPAITQNMSLGASGYEVSELQDYLVNQGLLPASTVTGQFDISTQSAVQKLQLQNGIATSGTPATTGYGAVGPKTQQFFAACRSAAANSTSNPAIANGEFAWGKDEHCSDNADGLLLNEDATTAQLRTCKPSTGDFMAAVKAAGGTIDTDTAIEILYGTTGSNSDYRNWSAILSSKDPVAAARGATGELYNSDLPYSDGTAYKGVPYQIVTQSGNLAWVEFENWRGSDGKPVQGLYVVDGNGVPLRNTSLDPIKIVTTAQNFGVLDPEDLKNLADKLDARGVDYKPGEVYAGSDAGVDLRGLAQGNLGLAAGSLNPEDCISKLPPKERGIATQQSLCVAPAETRLNAYLDYQETLLDSGDLKTSCKSITDPVQRSIYREWYARNDAYGRSFFQPPAWVGDPSSCSWLK